MKNYYNVTFKWDDDIYCANIAHAESEADILEHYKKREVISIRPACEYDVQEAKERRKPIVEC